MLKANGTYLGRYTEFEFEVDKGYLKITIDGKSDQGAYEKYVKVRLKALPMAGTYYPEKNSLLCIYNVIKQGLFFDDESFEIIESSDIGEIPTYNIAGIVY